MLGAGQISPNSAGVGLPWAQCGQTWPKLVNTGRSLANNMRKSGQMRPALGRANVSGRSLAKYRSDMGFRSRVFEESCHCTGDVLVLHCYCAPSCTSLVPSSHHKTLVGIEPALPSRTTSTRMADVCRRFNLAGLPPRGIGRHNADIQSTCIVLSMSLVSPSLGTINISSTICRHYVDIKSSLIRH